MNKCRVVVRILYCLAVCVFLIACAAPKQQLVRSKSAYDQVFKACLDATVDVNYGISSTDSKIGLIVAEQAVFGSSAKVVKLNIIVSRVGNMTEVKVNWIPPPGTSGGAGVVDKYIDALKKRIPDVEISAQ
jgi:hypothetical protein